MKPAHVKQSAITAILLLLLGAPAAVGAETEAQLERRLSTPDYARGGYYFGFEGLVAIENSPLISGDTLVLSGGLDIRLGYRHNRWFASELSGLYVHTYGDSTGNFLAWGITANERFYLTRRRIQPYLTAGLGFMQLTARNPPPGGLGGGFDPNFAMIFGLGFEIYATPNFVFTVVGNYNLPIGSGTDLDFVTAGVGMQFF